MGLKLFVCFCVFIYVFVCVFIQSRKMGPTMHWHRGWQKGAWGLNRRSIYRELHNINCPNHHSILLYFNPHHSILHQNPRSTTKLQYTNCFHHSILYSVMQMSSEEGMQEDIYSKLHNITCCTCNCMYHKSYQGELHLQLDNINCCHRSQSPDPLLHIYCAHYAVDHRRLLRSFLPHSNSICGQ